MYKKKKININSKLFYIQIFIIFLIVLFLTIYFITNIILGTTFYDNKTAQQQDELFTRYTMGLIISYIVNCLLIVGYLFYFIMGRHRIQLGYIFCLLWFIIFIAIMVSPHLLGSTNDIELKVVLGVIISILFGLNELIILYIVNQIRIQRQIQKYEKYTIHKKIRRG